MFIYTDMEYDPERGRRCTMCFDMRMERTALYAYENGFKYFTTTNATSRWKDVNQVNDSGRKAALKYQDNNIQYWEYNWQTNNMTKLKYEISVKEKFYKQEYCGCTYSLRDTNLYRLENNMLPIHIHPTTSNTTTTNGNNGEGYAGASNSTTGDSTTGECDSSTVEGYAGTGTVISNRTLQYFTDVEADSAEESQEVVDLFFKSAENNFNNEKRAALYSMRKKAATVAATNTTTNTVSTTTTNITSNSSYREEEGHSTGSICRLEQLNNW